MTKINLNDLDTLELDLFVRVGNTYCQIGTIDCPVSVGGNKWPESLLLPLTESVVLLPDIDNLKRRLAPTKAQQAAEKLKAGAETETAPGGES